MKSEELERAFKTGLRFQCPSCERKFEKVPFMTYATEVFRRTCRGCGERWQFVVEPRELDGGIGFLSIATFAFLGHTQPPGSRPLVPGDCRSGDPLAGKR